MLELNFLHKKYR